MRKPIGRGTKRISPLFILIVAAALVLSVILVRVIPIPGEWKKLVFFLMIPALSAAGIFLPLWVRNRKRR